MTDFPGASDSNWILPPIGQVLEMLQQRGFTMPAGHSRVGAFGDSAELSAELLALIRRGVKRGGACLQWSLEALGEELPKPGDMEVVLDHTNRPALITPTLRKPEA